MKITSGAVNIRLHISPIFDVFELRLGNSDKILSNSAPLEAQSRRHDHLVVARVLREMAKELEAQDG